MKLRNFLIVLFAVLMVFALASCKHEPKPEPAPAEDPWELYPYKDYTPTSNDVQVITITEGVETDYYNRDKLKIEWEEPVEAGDVVTLKYRSERTIYQWDIRNGSTKWVYETSKNNFTDPVIGAGGWATLTYTFADVDINGAELPGDTRFGIYFRGNFVEGDVFEIMDVKLNGEPLDIVSTNIKSAAALDEETIKDHVWNIPRNYAVLLATGKVGEVDKHPLIEKVAPGSTAQDLYDELEEDGGYIVKLYSDADKTTAYDLSTKILKDALIVYYERTGVERTVKFDLNGGTSATAIADVKVLNGQSVDKPATIPTKEGALFAEWCEDAAGTKPYDFTKAVKGDLTLYARYGVPRTVSFNTGEGSAIENILVADGMPVAKPADPTNGPYAIDGWYLGEEVYDFDTPVTADITIEVRWSDKTNVTLDLNYIGSEPVVFQTKLFEPLASTDEHLTVDERTGFTFDGWYDEAACTTEHVFTGNVEAPLTLYAKWIPAKIVTLTSTKYTSADGNSHDKFELTWESSGSDYYAHVGDVLSITFRTSEPFTQYSLRGAKKWIYEAPSTTTGAKYWDSVTTDGEWTTVTYTFPSTGMYEAVTYGDGAYFKVHFRNQKMVPGAVLEILSATLNGVDLPITAANVGSYGAPTLTTNVDCYVWTSHTVSFETDGAGPIAPETVEFGKKATKPAAPEKEGFVFVDWYKEAGLENVFDFGAAITSDVTAYAKFGAKKVVTFATNGGSEIAPAAVASGEKLVKPADPTKANSAFGGWFTDAECTVAYDFTTAVTEDFTLYAKWNEIWNVTLNYNYGTTPETKVVAVGNGEVMAEPSGLPRAGFYFVGWYDDAAGETAHNFANAVTADATIYAKWASPSKNYGYTATSDGDRWQFRWKGTSVATLATLKPGDTVTFMVKFGTAGGGTAPTSCRIRTANDSSEKSLNLTGIALTPDEAGWCYVTATIPEGTSILGQGILLTIDGTVKIGDTCDIRAIAFNGVEIPVSSSSTSSGLYPGVNASYSFTDI